MPKAEVARTGCCTSLLYGMSGPSINPAWAQGPNYLSKSARLSAVQVKRVCDLRYLSCVIYTERLGTSMNETRERDDKRSEVVEQRRLDRLSRLSF